MPHYPDSNGLNHVNKKIPVNRHIRPFPHIQPLNFDAGDSSDNSDVVILDEPAASRPLKIAVSSKSKIHVIWWLDISQFDLTFLTD